MYFPKSSSRNPALEFTAHELNFSPGIYTELKDSFENLSLVCIELSVSFYDFSDTSSLTWLISAK